MHIKNLDIVITDDDLNAVISQNIPSGGKISNIRATVEDRHLTFSGQLKVLLPINFEAGFKISHTKKEIIAQLAQVRPMSGIMDQLKNKILEKIVEFAAFARLDVDHEAIRIPLDEILKKYGLDSNLEIEDVIVAEKQLRLKVQGDIKM